MGRHVVMAKSPSRGEVCYLWSMYSSTDVVSALTVQINLKYRMFPPFGDTAVCANFLAHKGT